MTSIAMGMELAVSRRSSSAEGIFQKLGEIIDSNIFLTLFLTSLGYSIAYVYYLGYFFYFKLPAFLIDLNPSTLVLSILLTGFVGFPSLLYLLNYIHFDRRHRGKKWLYLVRMLLVAVVGVYVLAALDLLYIRVVLFILAIVFIVLFFGYCTLLIRTRNFRNALRGLFKNPQPNPHNPWDRLPDSLPVFFMVMVTSLTVSFLVGGLAARAQNQFLSIGSTKSGMQDLVIQAVGDDIYVKKYNTKSHAFESGFVKTELKPNSHFDSFYLDPPNDGFIKFLKQ